MPGKTSSSARSLSSSSDSGIATGLSSICQRRPLGAGFSGGFSAALLLFRSVPTHAPVVDATELWDKSLWKPDLWDSEGIGRRKDLDGPLDPEVDGPGSASRLDAAEKRNPVQRYP